MGTMAEMLSTPLGVIEWFVYLLAAVMFVIGLHLMNSPKTARKGNMVSAIGMVFAVAMAFIVLFGIFAVAALRIMPSVRSIMGAWTSLRYNRYTIDVLRDARLYDTPAGIDTTQERMPFEREIRIEGLSFHFDDAPDRDILHDLSLTIRKGERIGIRGASGVGKTTLFNILLGFYRPTQGEVLLDGRPLGQYSESCWRRDCGVVMQEATIFADTIARNIGVVDEQPDMERVRRAARMANIDEWIESLPMRYDTKIGLDGHGLSTGQRQRLFIARAAYKDAKYLFLDEATNSLDAANERSIMEKLQSFFEGRTVVVVAHRLSTVMNADNIVVLDRGRIVEQGTHKELTARRGHYYNLVRNQLELGN